MYLILVFIILFLLSYYFCLFISANMFLLSLQYIIYVFAYPGIILFFFSNLWYYINFIYLQIYNFHMRISAIILFYLCVYGFILLYLCTYDIILYLASLHIWYHIIPNSAQMLFYYFLSLHRPICLLLFSLNYIIRLLYIRLIIFISSYLPSYYVYLCISDICYIYCVFTSKFSY